MKMLLTYLWCFALTSLRTANISMMKVTSTSSNMTRNITYCKQNNDAMSLPSILRVVILIKKKWVKIAVGNKQSKVHKRAMASFQNPRFQRTTERNHIIALQPRLVFYLGKTK